MRRDSALRLRDLTHRGALPLFSTDKTNCGLPSSEDVTNNAFSEADMSEQTQAILDAAMKLPVAERSALVDQLMLSLDAEPLTESELDAMDALWAPEIRRRIAEVKSGQVQCIPWEDVDAEMRKLIGEQG